MDIRGDMMIQQGFPQGFPQVYHCVMELTLEQSNVRAMSRSGIDGITVIPAASFPHIFFGSERMPIAVDKPMLSPSCDKPMSSSVAIHFFCIFSFFILRMSYGNTWNLDFLRSLQPFWLKLILFQIGVIRIPLLLSWAFASVQHESFVFCSVNLFRDSIWQKQQRMLEGRSPK